MVLVTDEKASVDVAVVIPAYMPDRRFFHELLCCLQAQTATPREICIVDDGSREPVEVPRTLLPIRLIRQDNAGISGARNRGVLETSASIVHILDQDELLEPDFYESLLPAFDDPRVDVSFSAMRLVQSDGTPTPYRFPEASRQPPADWLAALIREDVVVGSSAALFRRSLWNELGGFLPYRFVQDWRFWLDAASRCQFAYCERELAYHRRHSAQRTDAAREVEALLEGVAMLGDVQLSMRYRAGRMRARAKLRLKAADKLPPGSRRLILSVTSFPVAPRSSIAVARGPGPMR